MCFEHRGRMEDLEEAITLNRAALSCRTEGRPRRALSLRNLAECLYDRFQKERRIDDLEKAIDSLKCAATHAPSSFSSRLEAVNRWSMIARSHEHHSVFEAHRTALSLLQRALTTRPTLSSQHKFLTLDAVLLAIDKHGFVQAIELLKQGRALLWSQIRGPRTPLDQLSEINKSLAERFEGCSRRLETLIASSESQEQESIINEIRRIPGFERFLRASSFDVLQQVASEGPVIMLNLSEYRSDTFIVLTSKDEPCFIDSVELHEELVGVRRKFGVGSSECDKILRQVMKILWDRVVLKVVERLKEIGIADGSRIWWCPTSVLTAFPFHAADKRASPDMVIRALRRVEWAHFTCHGILASEPFDSSLKLPGGNLMLMGIARARLPNAEFAFLLACHTAEQGYTTALLLDRDGPFLSKAVYGHLMYGLEEREMRFKGAAAAVREAALALREWEDEGRNGEELDVMTERWVNLVYMGA
ncbi:hypothetical protein A7U60_g6339 [Sanghuangporus baumii]|uniref:CHAT domain-containing protein n=1 Tax=Sanghuangporus baumii TaxID=108892 RepID=A0A9Q5N262_SANBA|nr:hypothetical protein A7U60_g6339 [Sanghuangporus baumii]